MHIFSCRSRWLRGTTAATVAATAAVSLAACSSDSGAGSSDGSSAAGTEAADYGDISLQLSWIKNAEFIGEYFADSKGYYSDAGFGDVNLVAGPSTGVAELVSGQSFAALSDAISVGTAVANEQAPVKIVGATFQKNPFTILSLKDGGNIATPADLKGKKIGVQDSNVSLFKALLAANGLTDKDVTVVPVQYDPSVLTNGEVDGFVAYLTNEALTVKAQGFDTVNLPFADNGLPFVAETVTVTDDSIKDDREKVKALLTAEIQGWTDALADPEGGIELAMDDYGKDLGLDKDTEVAGATEQNTKLVVSDETAENGLFTISDELEQETVKSLAGAGLDVTPDDIFDVSLLDEVYQENPGLKDYEG